MKNSFHQIFSGLNGPFSTRLKKKLFLLPILATFCFIGCSCSNTADIDTKTQPSVNVSSVSLGNCHVVIPERITSVEEADGTVSFLLSETQIGGITIIPYENADQLKLDGINEDSALSDTFANFVKLIVPDRNPDYFFSASNQGSFSLSVVNEDNSSDVIHHFFPDGDKFYDVFFEEKSIATPEEQQIILDSFALNS